jgi:hypothetical protein
MTTNPPDDLLIEASVDSPRIDFRFSTHHLSIEGESYPENAAAFYRDMNERTRAYLGSLDAGVTVTIDVALSYFNSSSTKVLFGLFNAFEEACARDIKVVLNWHHDAEDDTIEEFGAELHEEYPSLEFHDLPFGS